MPWRVSTDLLPAGAPPRRVHPFPFDEPALWRVVVSAPPARGCPFTWRGLTRCRHDVTAVWWLRCR